MLFEDFPCEWFYGVHSSELGIQEGLTWDVKGTDMLGLASSTQLLL